ncbi:C10 family peptidase, partial [bacterium]|nr:C10 family peptidase [bacterium]
MTTTFIQPIIAYSYESNFSLKDVPENVLLYMSRKDMKNRLNAIPVIDENIKKTNSQLWEAYSLGSEAFMQELQAVNQWPQGDNAGWLKTRWHQGNPNSPDDNYNQSCPVDPNMTNLRSHVGCAAVAMGQIVWYWQHPSSISFNDSDKYTSDDGDGERIIEIDGDSITYDFPSFATLNSRLSEINYDVDGPDINPDIPDLLFACGIIQHMGYSSAGSGAFLESSHFTDKLNYWHAAKLEESGNPQFYDLLQSNMKKCKPALLVIYTENWLTGHAIVADGYKENGDFHLNWGWGSSQPDPITGAWYNLPQGMPAEFTIVDYGIVNIIPTSNFSTKFKTGDNVRVASTILKIHNAPAGDEKTTLTKGSLGKVWADEGIYRELGGIGYRWWYVQMVNEGDGQTYTGWCAESGLEKTTPSLTITAGLVIDRSGSMNSSDRLPVAKSAAGYFVDASEAGDEMAISAFDYEPLLVSALTGITKTDPTNNSTKDSLKNDINALTTRKGKTNFGAGLQEVYNQLITSTKNQPTVAVFMSDGKHNIPSEDPSDYQPQIDLFKNKGWPIYTVGFGSDADEGRLKQIASQTGGQYYSGAANLTQLYSLIQTAMKGQSVMAAISGYLYGLYTIFRSLPIFDPTITYVKFLLSWPGSELDLVLISPDGTEIDPLMAASDPDIDYYKAPTYAYYTLNNPSAGEWRVKITGVDIPVGGEEYAVTVIASSPVISNMPGFKSGYAVGENIDIGLILREQTGPQTSIPITGANVLADVTRPDAVTDRLTLYDDGSHNDSLANDGIYGYEYTNTGTEGFYEILITAEGPGGTFTRQLQQTVEIGQAAPPLIAADFSGSPVTGCVPLTVNFSDSSTGGILSYLWDFGDGTTSAAKNPTHTYTNPGDYTVSLTVSGAAGSDAETRTGYITVNSCLSQLYLSKFSDPWGDSDCTQEIYKGAVITYYLNYGCESDAGAANVIVVDHLAPGLTVVNAGGGSYDYAAHTLTWNLGQINNEDTGTGNFLFFAAEVTADSGDCIENYAHISADNAGTFGSEFITHRVTEPLSLTANAGADGSICFGDWCPILDGSATGGTPPYTYSWFPITGLDNPHTASPSACPDTTTTYTLTVIDTNGYSAQDQATVEVCPLDGWEYPMSTYYHDARTQTICLSNEIGPACRITSLALDVIIVPGQTMEAWTIRMKHTSLSSYPGSLEWEDP